MDPRALPNGGHDPQAYHSPLLVNNLAPSGPTYLSRANKYPSNSNLSSRIPASDVNQRIPRMTPGIGGEQRPQHNVVIFDDPNARHVTLPTSPAYPLFSQEPAQPNQQPQSPRFPQAPTPPSPSFKALGKRRASSIDPPNTSSEYIHEILEPTSVQPPPYTAPTPASSAPDHTSRPKPKPKPKVTKAPVTRTRVMPSRQRRGTTAYGIGSNPIDAMIIEAQQRALETVPIVDPDAVFVITTDPKGPPIAGPSTSSAPETGKEDERYFERAEVAESMRQQAIIQTPEFCLLSEVYQPSSRLRTRTEAEVFDSSDAAYERRHRKPEMMEKRQRRREKDKLEHERYKLKERVEQLRTMDLHHFRALLPPGTGSSSDTGPELEHVRNELLAHADDLIRRYDVLLPPDPRAANGQRLRLKEWEIRREGNRFIPLTDEAASELAAAGLLDEQSAAEAAAAGILITAAGPGLPLLGGKGAEGYGSGFRPNLVPSDEEDEVEVEGETAVEGEVEVEHEEQAIHEDEEFSEPAIVQPVAEDARSRTVPSIDDVPPRPSSGALKIKLKLTRPSARSSDLSVSQDNTRAPSEQGSVGPQNETQPAVDTAPPIDPAPPAPIADTTSWASRGPPTAPRKSDEVPVYPSPAPSTAPLATSLSTATNGVWTELPYHDVPYEHQSREILSARLTPVPVLPAISAAPMQRMKTPRASTPTPVAVPALLAAAEREANQAAGRRGRNLRTAEAFGVKLPRVFEEEKDFNIPKEWIEQCKMSVDEQDPNGNGTQE